jgi:hypothetical protein
LLIITFVNKSTSTHGRQFLGKCIIFNALLISTDVDCEAIAL